MLLKAFFVIYTTLREFSWECPEKLFFCIYMIFRVQSYANWDAEVSRSRFKTVKNFWDQQNDFNSHNIGVQFYSEFFWTKVKLFSEFHFTAKFWVFKLKMRFRMAGGDKISSRHFFVPLLILLKKSSLLLFCKTRWLKGFYNISASM